MGIWTCPLYTSLSPLYVSVPFIRLFVPLCVSFTCGFRSRMVRRSAQRASRSPSQGRRPWWLPPPPRPAQRANRSTNRAGGERNCWPVGPAHVVVGPSRPAGPGWENGWPLGPPDACCPAARATTDPSGVPDGRRGSSAATTPGNGPQHRLHPEGGAKNRGSTGPARTTITDPPRTSVCGRVREVTRDKLDPAGGLALCRVSGVSAPHLGAHDPNTGRNPSWLRAYGPVPFYIPTTTNSSRPRDRQTRRFVATAQLTPRAVSHSDPRPHNP